jgi:hypothetical protein
MTAQNEMCFVPLGIIMNWMILTSPLPLEFRPVVHPAADRGRADFSLD